MSSWINGNLQGSLSIGQGERGKSLEYMWRGTELGIRVEGEEGEEEYQFVNLAGEGVGSGREIELQVGNGYIQWRYKDEEEWNNLISIDSLKGGNGKSLEYNWNGTELGIKREGDDSYSYVNLKGKDGRDGVDGVDGVTPNIKIGTVTTLEPGEKATVTREGTNENPIFNFGIPKGEKGKDGTGGSGTGGGSGKKLIARYIHNSNKTVQPTALDLASGVFTCDTPHNLIEGKKLWLRYNGDTAPANIPIELYNVNPSQWGRGQLKAHIIDEFSFQVYVKNGEFISFTNEKNKNVDVSKFSFEYDLQQIFIKNIDCNSIDFYCNGFITGGYFAVAINYIDSRAEQSDANASLYGQIPCYISYKGTTNFTEGNLSTHINLTSKTINYPSHSIHRSNGMKELLISYSVKPNSSCTNIKDIRPAFGEVYPLNGFIVEIWGGE